VFPNPFRADRHERRVMIAGLPAEATMRIVSAGGQLVRVLEERDGDGGRAWNLRDEQGRPAPAGIYFVRINADNIDPVLRKLAVIR
jgi:hypothetical protein